MAAHRALDFTHPGWAWMFFGSLGAVFYDSEEEHETATVVILNAPSRLTTDSIR
ncbi:MAG: hypothetical protein ACYTFG_22675 [Planctomycetota bacterium]|jgi:hypothetical protein